MDWLTFVLAGMGLKPASTKAAARLHRANFLAHWRKM
jgi:hypothetical protein